MACPKPLGKNICGREEWDYCPSEALGVQTTTDMENVTQGWGMCWGMAKPQNLWQLTTPDPTTNTVNTVLNTQWTPLFSGCL